MAKIVNLNPNKIGWKPLFHQILEQEGVEAIVCIVRVDGRWCTAWSNESNGGLAMATMKLQHDVNAWIHEMEESS